MYKRQVVVVVLVGMVVVVVVVVIAVPAVGVIPAMHRHWVQSWFGICRQQRFMHRRGYGKKSGGGRRFEKA